MSRFNIATHTVEIEPTKLGKRGQRYRVTYLGMVLIDSTRNPEFDACRALLARGVAGRLLVRRAAASSHHLVIDIERGARLTVHETDTVGPRLARWKPQSKDDAQTASVSCAVSSRTADRELAATLA